MPIKLIKSCFFDEAATKKALCEFIMGASQLSIGEQCRRFEASFAAWQGSRRCVFLNSGSSANLALVQAYLNLKRLAPGDAVAFSALTWATNVMPLVQLGLDPVPVDVETDTLNVSPRTLAEAYARKPFKALFLTNLLGFCDDLAGVADFCRSHGVRLLEDNCESMGSVFAGRKLGSWGEAGTFSTFVGHHMSTVEGGMVCTDDEELYEMLCMVRAHGWDRNMEPEAQGRMRKAHGVDGSFYAKYTFYALGYNLRPNEITGFLGLTQIPHLDAIVASRRKNFEAFSRAAERNPALLPLRSSHMDVCSNFAYPLVFRDAPSHAAAVRAFEAAAVEIRPVVAGDITRQPFWRERFGASSGCPNAAVVHERGFYFGNSPEYSQEEMAILCGLVSTTN